MGSIRGPWRSVVALAVSAALVGAVTVSNGASASETDPYLAGRFDELSAHVSDALHEANAGATASLVAKVDAAKAAYLRDQVCVSVRILSAFVREASAWPLVPTLADDLQHRGALLHGDLLASVPPGACRGTDAPPDCLTTAPWPDLVVTATTSDPQQAHELEGTVITATVGNRGGEAASAIPVAFGEAGTVFARAVIDAIPPCGDATITGFWPGGSLGPHQLDVMVDPDATLEEGTRLNNTGTVEVPIAFELLRWWEAADLRVSEPTLSTDRPAAGDRVTIDAVVENDGDTALPGVVVRFTVDGEPILTTGLPELGAASSLDVTASWTATPGRHVVGVEAEMPAGRPERDGANNAAAVLLHGGGGSDPLPDLVIELLVAEPGASITVEATLLNLGWANGDDIPLVFTVDGAVVADGSIDLAAGERTTIRDVLDVPLDCDHVVGLTIDPDRIIRKTEAPDTLSVLVRSIDPASFCLGPPWTERGPAPLANGWTGFIHSLVIDPTDTDTMYAAAPTGGVWKSINGGATWAPLSDRVDTLNTSALLLDPTDPSILYVGTDRGLYKSVNGGGTIAKFADAKVGTSFAKLIFDDHGAAGFDIYVGGSTGLWRYRGTDHSATTSNTATEWSLVKSGGVTDLVQHPTDASRFWVATRVGTVGKLFRSKPGAAPAGDGSWDDLTASIPESAIERIQLDVSPSSPQVMYAAVMPPGKYRLYRSDTGGDSWALRFTAATGYKWVKPTVAPTGGYWENWYNDYVVVDRVKPDTVYLGSVQAYRTDNGGTTLTRIQGIHDDQHGFTADPADPSIVHFMGDGGLFRCTSRGASCSHRNTTLGTFQFFDIAVASSADRVIGGSQDNGTVRTNGFATWDLIRGGDGRYVAVDATNWNVVYSQNQYLGDTRKAVDGFSATNPTWRATTGLPPGPGGDCGTAGCYLGDPFIRLHPTDPDLLFGAWTEVARHPNATEDWAGCATAAGCTGFSKIGPTGIKGVVKRVAVEPSTGRYYAGTSGGELWVSETTGSTWVKVFTQGAGTGITGIAPDPYDPDLVWLTFEGTGAVHGPQRVWRLERVESGDGDTLPGPIVQWVSTNVTKDLPLDLDLGAGWQQSNMIVVDPTYADVVYVATSKGVLRGAGGMTESGFAFAWRPMTCGLPNVRVTDLEVHPGSKLLYAATWGRGLWTVSLAPTGPD